MPQRPQLILVVQAIQGAAKWGEGRADNYNDVRLNSAIGYITPKDIVAGHHQEIQADRGSEIGGGEGTAEESPPAGRPTDETDYFRLADQSEVENPNGSFVCFVRPISKTVLSRRVRSLWAPCSICLKFTAGSQRR
jgi:hypothetical protein